MNDFFIMQKIVDRSVLCQGMTIPQMFHDIFYKKIGFRLRHGQFVFTDIALNGTAYKVKVVNQGFDTEKYFDHKDVLQIRYDSNHDLIDALRAAFPLTWNKLSDYHKKNNTYKGFRLHEGNHESIAIYANEGTMLFECLPLNEYAESVKDIKLMDERVFENDIFDKSFIEEKVGIKKIRHLSRGICNSLKEIYSYRCQICGEYIGEKYGSHLIHAHHIDYFTKSLNNNPNNILIVCPNHHGIIHDCDPVFDYNRRVFEYPNGYTEGLLLNMHI